MAESEQGILQTTKTFGYRWKIEHFFADCKKAGDYYTSPVFSIHCHDKVTEWYLKVFPKGRREKYKNYVSLYLVFKSDNVSDEATVGFRLSIISGQDTLMSNVSQEKSFKGPTYDWGWPDFVKRIVTKNSVTILCDVTFSDQAAMGKLEVYDDLLNNIRRGLEDFETLLESNHFSDVTFNIEGNQMHLHKAILMCRNSVFKAMFEQKKGLKKRQKLMDVVDITDVPYKVMKEVFRFIYSGKVENIDQLAKYLLFAANKYAIPELKALCEKKLYQDLTVDNAIECLKLADVCDTIHLKTLVMEFIAAHCKDISKKPGFIDLDKWAMHQIIQLMTEKD